jgi:GDP/UDP-N,N'-diacetylbacillosamine 2-epimerase (hydrolysing)
LNIAVVTSSRADYGILKPLLFEIEKNKNFKLQIIATGTHLEKQFGNTYLQIEKDGFEILKKIKLGVKNTSVDEINNSIGKLIPNVSKAFSELKTDLVILLGDRFEIFASAISAYVLQIPIVHIHGGETSAGAFDEGFRHSITKLSSLHFVICEEYRKRVIQLGENPKTVFNVGSLAIDNLNAEKLLSAVELEKELNFKFKPTAALVTYHPVTLEKNTSLQHLKNLFEAFKAFPDLNLIINKSNSDTDGILLNKEIENFVSKRKNAILVDSLGTKKFLSTLKNVDLMIGNSSAGIIEMPMFKHPTINIGDRQKGRYMAESVISCGVEVAQIEKAIKKGLNKKFIEQIKTSKYPFGKSGAAKMILNQIEKSYASINLKKAFYDLH